MRKTFHALILNCKLFTFHCMAFCGYSLLVGGHCGPSSFNPANAECVAIGECSKDAYNHIVYCKISDNIAVDSEWKLLLTRAGRWFPFRHYKFLKNDFLFGHFSKLISGIFETEQSHLKITVCSWHRYLFGIRWRCNKARCSMPTSAGIDAHI